VSPRLLFLQASPGSTATASITISDTGSGALQVNVGQLKAPFSVISNAGAVTLAPGQSETVVVRYAPPKSDINLGILSITSDDPSNRTLDVIVLGESLGFGF
jgi:hypothetical protein